MKQAICSSVIAAFACLAPAAGAPAADADCRTTLENHWLEMLGPRVYPLKGAGGSGSPRVKDPTQDAYGSLQLEDGPAGRDRDRLRRGGARGRTTDRSDNTHRGLRETKKELRKKPCCFRGD